MLYCQAMLLIHQVLKSAVIAAMSPVFYDSLAGIPGINTADALNPHYLKFIPYELCIGERSFLKLVVMS